MSVRCEVRGKAPFEGQPRCWISCIEAESLAEVLLVMSWRMHTFIVTEWRQGFVEPGTVLVFKMEVTL